MDFKKTVQNILVENELEAQSQSEDFIELLIDNTIFQDGFLIFKKDKLKKFFIAETILSKIPNKVFCNIKQEHSDILNTAVEIKNHFNSTMYKVLQKLALTETTEAELITKISNEITKISNSNKDKIVELFEKIKINYNQEKVKNILNVYQDNLTSVLNQQFFIQFLKPNGIFNSRHTDVIKFNNFIETVKDMKQIMLCDMANFKQINDEISYEAGDFVLKEFAKQVQEVAWKKELNLLPIRVGGDEFIIFGDEKAMEELKNLFNSKDFMEKITNYPIDSNKSIEDKPQTFVGFGISDITFCKVDTPEDIAFQKQEFYKSFQEAEQKMKEYKDKTKEAKNIISYRTFKKKKIKLKKTKKRD